MKGNRKNFPCPHCGALVPVGCKACPECGSDERTGWSENTYADGLDLPEGYEGDKEFDYDAYIRKEFAWDPERGSKPPIPARQLILPFLVLLLVAALVWGWF